MEERFQDLCEFVTDRLEATGIPGAALGIVHNEVTYTAGFGITSIENPLAVTDDTLFQIGSITKTFVALLLLQLADDGKVDLDKPVQAYLPNFRVQDEDVSAKVTVRHLLTHTAGWIGDVFLDTGAGDDAVSLYVEAMADLPQLAPIGKAVSYNNAGFSLCGAVIEAVTGQHFGDVLQERILAPLGMGDAYLSATDVITKRFAVGHSVQDEPSSAELTINIAEPWELSRSLHAAGAISCPMRDLLKYAWFQMGDGCNADGERLVSAESWRDLHTQQVAIDSAYDGVALSWFTGSVNDELSYLTHTGGTNGQISQLLVMPDANFAVAILTNANRGREVIGPIVEESIRLFLDAASPQPESNAASAEEMTELCGRYARPHAEIELRLEDEQLMLHVTPLGGFPNQDAPPPPAPPPAACALYGEDRLIVLAGPSQNSHLEIVRLDNGDIGWIRLGMRLHRRLS